jgi:ADP-ribose pyrophosphatase YjhB (NUDIX family)
LAKIRVATQKEYNNFRKYFAFSSVDLVIFDGNTVLLTKRTRKPYSGYWHLPGSLVRKGENIQDAIRRSAKTELNLSIRIKKFVGVYESLDKFRHDISHAYIVTVQSGKLKTDYQSSAHKFFERLPSKTIPHHRKIIRDAKKNLHT